MGRQAMDSPLWPVFTSDTPMPCAPPPRTLPALDVRLYVGGIVWVLDHQQRFRTLGVVLQVDPRSQQTEVKLSGTRQGLRTRMWMAPDRLLPFRIVPGTWACIGLLATKDLFLLSEEARACLEQGVALVKREGLAGLNLCVTLLNLWSLGTHWKIK